jgi:large subunit ribosomal protein L4
MAAEKKISARAYSVGGQEKGNVDLPDFAFGAPARPDVVYDALRSYLANQRQGTVATKTRSFVSGGGKKPWRQKGTGRARHGSIRSPIWVGGATVFGPQPRDYTYRLPRKMRSLAMRTVMSDRARDGKVLILDDFLLETPKTKTMSDLLKTLNLTGNKVLFICSQTGGEGGTKSDGRSDTNLYRSVRNLARAECTTVEQLNVYQLLEAEVIIVTTSGLDGLSRMDASGKTEKEVA